MSNILIIEDDAAVRSMVATTLQAAGHTVSCAVDGQQGLDMFYRQHADVVVTDIFMPKMDGLEVIHSLRRCMPSGRIIALRNNQESMNTPLLLKILEKYGIEGVMVKPVQASDLLGCVTRALQKGWSLPTPHLPEA